MSTDLEPWLAELVTDRWDLVAPDLLATVSTTPGRYVHHVRAGTAEGRRHFAVKVDTDAGMQSGSRVAVQAWVALRDAELAARVHLTRLGEFEASDGRRRVTVTDWFDGRAPDDSSSTWGRVGEALARLHALPMCPQPFAVPVGSAADELLRQSSDYDFGDDFAALVPRIRTLPAGRQAIVHGEVNAANVVVAATGEIRFVDWDQAGRGSVALDLGHPLICVFLTVDLQWNSAQAAAFYAGYRAACPTHLAPPSHDVFTAGLLHAMRYLHFADHLARWERIRWAVAHERELTELMASPSDFS